MYENGRKVSRYYKMREHKRRMKDRFLKNPYSTNIGKSYAEYLADLNDDERSYHYGGNMMPCAYQYWNHYYAGERGKIAKKQTVRAIRNYWREELSHLDDADDLDASLNSNDYHKLIDYAWIVW